MLGRGSERARRKEPHDPTTKQVELFIGAGRPYSALCVALAERLMRLPWGRIGFALAFAIGAPAAAIHLGPDTAASKLPERPQEQLQ